MRTGLIAQKLGMSSMYASDGSQMPVTVLKVDNCQVVATRSAEKEGYTALQLGAGIAKVKNVSKAQRGHFAKSNVEPKRFTAEFRVSDDAVIDIGAELTADHFVPGQYVDVVGTSKGKGFSGGMKRHGFSGLRASHGVSINHRSLGSTGQCQDPGKVFKGKKMAGQMGNGRVTLQNLEVVQTDSDKGLIIVRGAVPGSKGGQILVSDALKKALPEEAPIPGAIRVGTAPVKDKTPELSEGQTAEEGAVEEDFEESPVAEAPPEEVVAHGSDGGDGSGDDTKETKD